MADLNTASPCGAPTITTTSSSGLNNAGAPYSTPAPFGCALCFRKLTQRWTTCKPEVLRALLRVDRPPYADIVVHWLERSAAATAAAATAAGNHHHQPPQHQRAMKGAALPTDALLCDYCACFVKERTVRSQPPPPAAVAVAAAAIVVVVGNAEEEDDHHAYYSHSGGSSSSSSASSSPSSASSSSSSAAGHDDDAAADATPQQKTPPPPPQTPPAAEAVQIRRGRKHGMHMAVEHVLSGGSMPAPSRPHFLRCLAILDQPNHPFWQVQQGDLGDRLSGRKRVRDAEDCVVRWLFEGRQHVFSDAVMAKNMRRWISSSSGGGDSSSDDDEAEAARALMLTIATAPLPDACRFCCRAAQEEAKKPKRETPGGGSYAGALVFEGKQMEQALLRMEQEAAESMVESGLVLFCIKCHRVSALSHEYDCALRAWLLSSSKAAPKESSDAAAAAAAAAAADAPVCRAGLSHADAYYARLMTLFYLRRGGAAAAAAAAADLALVFKKKGV